MVVSVAVCEVLDEVAALFVAEAEALMGEIVAVAEVVAMARSLPIAGRRFKCGRGEKNARKG